VGVERVFLNAFFDLDLDLGLDLDLDLDLDLGLVGTERAFFERDLLFEEGILLYNYPLFFLTNKSVSNIDMIIISCYHLTILKSI
jgi:hypothetical protein